ncbi:nucleotide exchange factor GrpE [Anaerosalibacter sp. Marseille-P3206]|uniref:nucleotide exchange factor GrpE n=1 Tax=Anaerosalibacter sp. Marseille-P3206 TaxID=1871005 RepID=UPI0009876221|nr:nucleotide exchange factor GrpE [Anaerosalibacter sp. Marseille-P3206]
MENKDVTVNEDVRNGRVEENQIEDDLIEEVTEEEKKEFEEAGIKLEKVSVDGLKKLVKEKEEISNQYLRLQADFINYKNRVEKEKENLYSHASEDLLCALLPVLDNFERALESVENTDDSFYKGMEMIYDQFDKALKEIGLEEIDAIHEKFDPNYHHAALQEESEEFDEGIVLDVFQKGYMFKDKVIRPSMVKVSK